jgi:two-component SAPR family response regulator
MRASLAFFGHRQADLWTDFGRALGTLADAGQIIVLRRDGAVPKGLSRAVGKRLHLRPLGLSELGFDRVPIGFALIKSKLVEVVAEAGRAAGSNERLVFAIDMDWGLQTNTATANFEGWMAVAWEIASECGVTVASLYNRSLLIDEHLLAALRGHPEFLLADRIVSNPHWLPPALMAHGTLRECVDHWLEAVSPELRALGSKSELHAAEGAAPMWLSGRRTEDGTSPKWRERWKIRCFGRLRVYRSDGSQVDWGAGDGATHKTKTLFAYLLQQGGKGATVEELADLLWPEAESIEASRNRLYHVVRCLRLALAGNDKQLGEKFVLREAGRYVLVPPDRSWLDISAFEQLCRQSQGHIKAGASDEALICLQGAERLYTGDLFEDIPADYIDTGERDWCWTRRYWLRDMFLKVLRDAARLYRQRQEHSAALNQCQKALAIDPLCEFAHEESMRVYHALGRREAIERQYSLYVDSLSRFDDRPRSEALARTCKELLA